MSNISKIKISGTSYNLKDENACKVVELTQAEYDDLPTSAKTSNSLFVITDATAGDLSNYYTKSETSGATEISTALESKADTATTYTKTETDNSITAATSTKQDTLVSGTNIKTINGETLLGEGNITIEGGGGGGKAIKAGRGITVTTGETADTVSFNLSLSSSTLTSDSIVGGYFGNKSMAQYGFAFGDNANCGNGGSACIALGRNVTANGNSAIALGSDNTAKGKSVAIGRYINTNIEGEIGVGVYNVSSSASTTFGDSGNTLFSVGNGTSNSERHNAFEIRQNGDIYISKDGQDVKLQDQLGGGGSSYTAGDGIDINNDVISVTGKVDTSTYNTYTAATDTALASKQTTLTAGNGISIVDNVISATGGGGGLTEDDELLLSTALTDLNDRKIDASDVKENYQKKGDYATKDYVATALEPYETKLDEINTEEVTAYALNDLNNRFGGLSLVKITESEYAALTAKDENTLYIVVADPS